MIVGSEVSVNGALRFLFEEPNPCRWLAQRFGMCGRTSFQRPRWIQYTEDTAENQSRVRRGEFLQKSQGAASLHPVRPLPDQ